MRELQISDDFYDNVIHFMPGESKLCRKLLHFSHLNSIPS